jgi:hypothetical protein
MSSISDGEAFRAVRRFFAGRFAVGIWRVSMDLTLFTDQLTLTQSERRRVTGVEEDESTGSSLRWFVAAPHPSRQLPSLSWCLKSL